MLKYTTLLLIITFFLAFTSCKKEKTSWDTNWTAPIAYGHLTLADFVEADHIVENSEGYITLVFQESVLEFSLDTLIKLPDTTIVTKTAIGLPSLDVTPSFSFPDNYDQQFELGEILLKNVIIQSGFADAKISSPWSGKTRVTATFPNVNRDGIVLERTYNLEAGTTETPSSAEDVIDMTFQSMDLRGVDGDEYNTLAIDLLVQSNEEEATFVVSNYDSIAFSFQFRDLVPNYARGYFGHYYFSDTTGFSLAPLKKIIGGNIELDSIKLNIEILNGFNLLAQAKISKLTGINNRTSNLSEFDFAEKNTLLNINPASGGYYDYAPSSYPININNNNSNILAFIENLSDSLIIGYELEVNPFGNITGANDEFFPDSKMQLIVDGEFPLNFGANELTIQDTFEIKQFESGNIDPQNAYATLSYTNAFPLSAEAEIIMVDEIGIVLDTITSSSPLIAGTYNDDSFLTYPSMGTVNFDLDQSIVEHLMETKQLILNITFNSYNNEKVKINTASYLDFNLSSNLNLRLEL